MAVCPLQLTEGCAGVLDLPHIEAMAKPGLHDPDAPELWTGRELPGRELQDSRPYQHLNETLLEQLCGYSRQNMGGRKLAPAFQLKE